VELVSYRLEDLKSGTIQVNRFLRDAQPPLPTHENDIWTGLSRIGSTMKSYEAATIENDIKIRSFCINTSRSTERG
jgi:hypothetical protein